MRREGEIIRRVGWVVMWLEMGGLEGVGGWGGVDRRGGRFAVTHLVLDEYPMADNEALIRGAWDLFMKYTLL